VEGRPTKANKSEGQYSTASDSVSAAVQKQIDAENNRQTAKECEVSETTVRNGERCLRNLNNARVKNEGH